MSFLLSLFCCPGFQHAGLLVTSLELGFLCIELSPWELLASWTSVTWLLPHRGQLEIVSARLNLRNITIDTVGVCDLLGSVSLQQKFEVMDRPVLWLHVTVQFY